MDPMGDADAGYTPGYQIVISRQGDTLVKRIFVVRESRSRQDIIIL